MRSECSGEQACGLVVINGHGHATVNTAEIKKCMEHHTYAERTHCALTRLPVTVMPGEDVQEKRQREETLYQLRLLPLMKDESKIDFARRMKRLDSKKVRFTTLIAERLVDKDATQFAALLQRLGMKFKTRDGRGADSFVIQ